MRFFLRVEMKKSSKMNGIASINRIIFNEMNNIYTFSIISLDFVAKMSIWYIPFYFFSCNISGRAPTMKPAIDRERKRKIK